MTQLFDEDGTAVPVTAIEAGPCPVVQVRTESRDGYRAIQLGYGRKKVRRSRKPEEGHARQAGLDHVPSVLHEFRLGPEHPLAEDPHTPASPVGVATATAQEMAEGAEPEEVTELEEATEPEKAAEAGDDVAVATAEAEAPGPEAGESDEPSPAEEGFRVGQTLTVELFRAGDRVAVTGRTKGRGFQGVVKRHGFSGRPKTHGHSSVRVPGSIGPGTDPSRVIKGRKMGGQMGNEQRTIRNMEVVKVDADRNLLFVKGSVPGARNSWVFVRKQ